MASSERNAAAARPPAGDLDVGADVTRRRLIRRGALGAGLAVAGGALLRPGAASAADGDPVLASQTVSALTGETGLSGACSPSVLHLTQSSTSDDGLLVDVTDPTATGRGVNVNQTGTGAGINVNQAGTGPALNAAATGSNTAPAVTAAGTASLPANHGVIEATNNSTTGTAYAVRATATGAGGGVFASAASAPAVTAQSTGSGAALFAKNTSSGPGVSVTTTGNGAALLLTSGGTAILASTTFNGSPAGVADKAGISITTQSSTGTYVKAEGGRALYAENTGVNETVFVTNSGNKGNPRGVVVYLANPTATGSAIYGSTAGKGAGVEGRSNAGRGGQFTGALAQVRLLPGNGPHPASGLTGDLYLDNRGALWFCKGGANWKQIA